jgi:hypothetical protein
MSVSPNCFDTSAGMGAATPPYRSTPTLRLDRGLCHSLHQPTPGTSASPADLLRHLGWTGASPSLYRHTRGLRRHQPTSFDTSVGPGASSRHIDCATSQLHQAELFARAPRDRLGGWDLDPP